MTHATLSKTAEIDFGGMDVDKTFAELAAELTAPKPEKLEWNTEPATIADTYAKCGKSPMGILNGPQLNVTYSYAEWFNGGIVEAAKVSAQVNDFIDLAEKAKTAKIAGCKYPSQYQAEVFTQHGDHTAHVKVGQPESVRYTQTLPTPAEVTLTRAECAAYADAAADALERHGWIQGQYGTPEIGMCAAGAISYVTMNAPMSKFRASHVFAAVCDRIQMREMIGSIPNWNDRPNQTKAGVVAAFRGAAESFRKEA